MDNDHEQALASLEASAQRRAMAAFQAGRAAGLEEAAVALENGTWLSLAAQIRALARKETM